MVLPEDFWIKIAEHLSLSLGAICISLPLALGIALFTQDRPSFQRVISALMNIFQTIPSLALFAFLIPWLGIGILPALFALTLYATLPILRNTITGLQECPSSLIEAGQMFGLNRFQLFLQIRFPQSFPFILSGVRTALVWTIGSTSLVTFIGAGGLGDYIARGIALLDTRLLLTGAIPTALLAIIFDTMISWCEKRAFCWKQGKR